MNPDCDERLARFANCTNSLQLPLYDNKEQLEARLGYALAEGAMGFGLA